MNEKQCSKCKQILPLEAFNRNSKRKDGRQTFCRECSKEKMKDHYNKNQEQYRERNRKIREEVRRFLYDYLSIHPCVDCGESDIACLDFDHRDDVEKSFNIAQATKMIKTVAAVKKEIAKCDVRCANCHRKRTAKQFNWYNFTG